MTGRGLARATVCTVLPASGVVTIAASAQRWWPCRPFAFDAPGCVQRQGLQYGYLVPSDPWVPVGTAAQVAGIGFVLLAVGLLTLPRALTPEAPRWAAWVVGAGLSSSVAVLGVITFAAGRVGHPVGESILPTALLLWIAGWPVALGAVFVLVVVDSGRLRWRVAALCLLMCSWPVLASMISSIVFGYASDGDAPWMEGVSGAFVVLAAAAAWVGTGGRRWSGRRMPAHLVPATREGLA